VRCDLQKDDRRTSEVQARLERLQLVGLKLVLDANFTKKSTSGEPC